jgi:hypothetical protein
VGRVHAAVDDAGEVLVIEAAHDPHLAGEPLHGLRVGPGVDDRTRAVAEDELEGDETADRAFGDLEVLGPVDLPHVPGVDRAQQLEPSSERFPIHCHSSCALPVWSRPGPHPPRRLPESPTSQKG